MKNEYVSTFTLEPKLKFPQRLALFFGSRLFVDIAAASVRNPVRMTVNAVVRTARNGRKP